MKTSNIIRMASVGLLCSMLLVACQQENSSISTPRPTGQASATKNQKKIVYAVLALTEDGYVLAHGDHQHLEKGSVPYDAVFTKDTLLDNSSYQLNEKHILYKVRTGYIIQVDGKVYYYPKKSGLGIVSLDEAREMTKNNQHHAHHHHDHSHDHSSSQQHQDGGIAGIDRTTSDGFLLTSEKQIQQRTDKGLVVSHNGHSHFFFYGDLRGTKWAYLIPEDFIDNPIPQSVQTQSSHSARHEPYQFDPKDIVAEDVNGYTVRHGDHYHYVLKSTLTERPVIVHDHLVEESATASNFVANQNTIGIAGIDRPTSDGFLFDGTGIIGRNEVGLLVHHAGHTHVLKTEDVQASKWSYLLNKPSHTISTRPKDRPVNATIPSSGKEVPLVVDNDLLIRKRDFLAHSLGVAASLIRLVESPSGPAFLYPHGDHHHLVALSEIDVTQPIESPEEVDRKIDYITKVYGVPREAVRVSDTTFSFNDPNHAYDPTHVHPYVILKSMLVIPPVTGDPEVDFEAELLAVAKRTGIEPSKLVIRNNQFILSHGNHDHALNIQAVEGIEPYLKNKLPAIAGPYVAGTFTKETVLDKVVTIEQLAKQKYGISSKEYRRIQRSLTEFSHQLDQLVTNSTEGYLKMLDVFEKTYVLKERAVEQVSQHESVYNRLLQKIQPEALAGFPISTKELIEKVNQASQSGDLQTLLNVEHLLEQLESFRARPQLTVMEYTDYLLQQVDRPYVPHYLQERLLNAVVQGFAAGFGGRGNPLELAPELIELKIALHQAEQSDQTYSWQTSPAYQTLMNEKEFISDILGEIRDTFIGTMSFPVLLSNPKTTDTSQSSNPSSAQVTEEYNRVLTLLRQTNLTEFGLQPKEWLEKVNQASLVGDRQKLITLHHILLELQKFQDRPEMTGVEYMDYLVKQMDKKTIKEETREKVSALLNQLYLMIIRRESAESPKAIAGNLVTVTVALAEENAYGKEYPMTAGEQYSLYLQNSQEMRTFIEGVRDMLLSTVHLPEGVGVDRQGENDESDSAASVSISEPIPLTNKATSSPETETDTADHPSDKGVNISNSHTENETPSITDSKLENEASVKQPEEEKHSPSTLDEEESEENDWMDELEEEEWDLLEGIVDAFDVPSSEEEELEPMPSWKPLSELLNEWQD